MAQDLGVGMRVVATVVSANGACKAGHKPGESFPISCMDSAGLCGYFFHHIFPDLQTFQFGGNMPWWEGDTIEVECPDPADRVVLRLERSKRA